MSEQEFRVERCGGLDVYHPIKKQERWSQTVFINNDDLEDAMPTRELLDRLLALPPHRTARGRAA